MKNYQINIVGRALVGLFVRLILKYLFLLKSLAYELYNGNIKGTKHILISIQINTYTYINDQHQIYKIYCIQNMFLTIITYISILNITIHPDGSVFEY